MTPLLVGVATAGLFVGPYLLVSDGWPARYVLADMGIVGIIGWSFGRGAIARLGMAIPASRWVVVGATFVAAAWVSSALVGRAAAAADLEILAPRPWFSLSQVFH